MVTTVIRKIDSSDNDIKALETQVKNLEKELSDLESQYDKIDVSKNNPKAFRELLESKLAQSALKRQINELHQRLGALKRYKKEGMIPEDFRKMAHKMKTELEEVHKKIKINWDELLNTKKEE